ncbi:hypothetical protein LMOSLCC7179_1359 [Listeria monocytogenes SLCC7179]|nr:hypothetical protein LMOSLCC7179_1359 [Listeria monocytogenes SLCC7179]
MIPTELNFLNSFALKIYEVGYLFILFSMLY